MAERSGLLNRRTGTTCTGGSNPPLSAKKPDEFSSGFFCGGMGKNLNILNKGKHSFSKVEITEYLQSGKSIPFYIT